jgi:Protein of unknown function (DUF3011)/Ricin-type beta-trefoil lectin domain-like
MKNIGVSALMNRNTFFAAFTMLAVTLAGGASGSLSSVLAQGSGDRAIDQAQRAVREQITGREGGRNPTVVFNSDAQTEFISNTGVRVRGTGAFSRNNDSHYANSRNNDGQSRNFSYEAIVNNRYRNRNSNGNVSGVRYDWRGGWSGYGGGDGGNGGQSIYCASDDGRRHTCPVNTGGVVRLVTQKSGSACVQGRTWGFNRNSIWVDRGCRADFEVGRGRGDGAYGRDNDGGDNNSGYGNVNRPNGRVTYSGPIMNRHSNKALDVTEQGIQDGANIQQWSYADQPNQNWDVIDLGNREVAIISRHSGRALTVQGGRANNGANIIQRGWNDSPQQRWRLERVGDDYYRIVSVDNGKCLDVTEEGKQNGAGIQLLAYASQANQQWRLRQ